MTIISTNVNVQARVRARRRRIAGSRQSILNGRVRRSSIIAIICFIMIFGGYLGIRGDWYSNSKLDNGAYAAEVIIYEKVTVYSGDTLWDIACEYTEPSKDVRKLVKEICDLNDVSPGKIYPGQVLLVPVHSHSV